MYLAIRKKDRITQGSLPNNKIGDVVMRIFAARGIDLEERLAAEAADS